MKINKTKMKIDLESDELDLVIKALNFVAECCGYDDKDPEGNEAWLKDWIKEFSGQSVKAEELLDSLAEEMGLT